MKNLCYESTSNCLLKCPYCISSDNGVMKKDHYLEIIDFIGNLLPERLVIGGGEPLIDPLLKEKIALIIKKYQEADKEPYISISTNGTSLMDQDMWLFLKNTIQCLDISLPSLNHDTYAQMRGVDLLNQVLINIRKAVSYGLNVRLSIIMTKQNYNELENLLKFANEVNVNSVRVGRYFPFRDAYDIKDDYELDETTVIRIIDNINNGKYANIYRGKILPPIRSLSMMKGYLNVNFDGMLFVPNMQGKKLLGSVSDVDINALEASFKDSQPKIFIKYKEK